MRSERAQLPTSDLAIDHSLAQLSGSVRFLLDVTPVNADEVADEFIEGNLTHPDRAFNYRELESDLDVLDAQLADVRVEAVEDTTLAHLLRAKHREMELHLEMLRVRDSDDFLALSIELYGGVSPALRDRAETLLDRSPAEGDTERLDPEQFLALAKREIDHYRGIDPDISIHVEMRSDVSGVLVDGDTLFIGDTSAVTAHRAQALLHHEVGTHLVTHVNGSHQPIHTFATGLAGYDETQEGLAVLAEVACGGLTLRRLRQLASRVTTVHRMVGGASFDESYAALLQAHVPPRSAFNTVMRIYRAGGLTKDAIYLRGLLDLLEHLNGGGSLDLLWLGKFSLRDLPLVAELEQRDLLAPARVTPRYLDDPDAPRRLQRAADSDDLHDLIATTEESP